MNRAKRKRHAARDEVRALIHAWQPIVGTREPFTDLGVLITSLLRDGVL